jgi:hypothetical protein
MAEAHARTRKIAKDDSEASSAVKHRLTSQTSLNCFANYLRHLMLLI